MAKGVQFVDAKKKYEPEIRHFPGSQLKIVIEMRNYPGSRVPSSPARVIYLGVDARTTEEHNFFPGVEKHDEQDLRRLCITDQLE